MNPLDAAPTSDNRISMEGLKALLVANAVACTANAARIALLCAAPSTTTSTSTPTPEPRTAQTVDATTAPDTRDYGNYSDLDGTVATLPVPVASLLLHSASEISLPLHAVLEFQPLTPTGCSTQCSADDAGVMTPAFDRGTSPSTMFGSSWRPLQLEGDQDNRCIEANGDSRAYVSALDSPSSSSHTATPINTSKLDVGLPTKSATMSLDHDIGLNLAVATPPCTGCMSATSGGSPPTPARRPATLLELDKLTPIRCSLLGSGADTFNDGLTPIRCTMDFLITQCKQYVPLWQSLSFISGCWLNTRGKVMEMELWATTRQLCLSCNSCSSYLRSKHGPTCAFIDSCLAAAAENCWCYPFWAKSCTNLEANLKCYLETLASLVPCSGSLGLGAQVQQEPNDDGLSSWSSFLNDHFNCSDGKNQKCLLQANKAIYICHSLDTALVCWQLPWPCICSQGVFCSLSGGVHTLGSGFTNDLLLLL